MITSFLLNSWLPHIGQFASALLRTNLTKRLFKMHKIQILQSIFFFEFHEKKTIRKSLFYLQIRKTKPQFGYTCFCSNLREPFWEDGEFTV